MVSNLCQLLERIFNQAVWWVRCSSVKRIRSLDPLGQPGGRHQPINLLRVIQRLPVLERPPNSLGVDVMI